MINTFVECPSKFNRLYILGETEKSKSSALEFGTAIHEALESLFNNEDPYTSFNMYWESIKSNNLEYTRYSWDDLKELAIQKFLPNFIRLHSKKFVVRSLEETIEAPFMGHTLQGTIDNIALYENELTITDYKTSDREYPVSKLIRNPQLYIYAYLYQQKYNILPQQIMYKIFIKSEGRLQTRKILLTQEKLDLQMNNISSIVKNMLHMIESKTFYSNYNCWCTNEKFCF